MRPADTEVPTTAPSMFTPPAPDPTFVPSLQTSLEGSVPVVRSGVLMRPQSGAEAVLSPQATPQSSPLSPALTATGNVSGPNASITETVTSHLTSSPRTVPTTPRWLTDTVTARNPGFWPG